MDSASAGLPSLALGCIFLLAPLSGAEVWGDRDSGVLEIMVRDSRMDEYAVGSLRTLFFHHPDWGNSLAKPFPQPQGAPLRP